MSDDERQAAMFSALGRVPSGLFILTYGNGEHGAAKLVSWVQQSSFEPPMVTVALNRQRVPDELNTAGSRFVLNQLSEGQTQLLRHFGKGFSPTEPMFEGIELVSATGPAILARALAFLHCEVASRVESGDHDLIIGRVAAGKVLSSELPYVHIRKSGLRY